MKSFIAGLLSYLVGIMTYILTLRIVWDESLGGDVYAVTIMGGMFYFVILHPLYLLTIKVIRESSIKHKSALYPLACMLVYFVPTSLIMLVLGGNISSPEAILFHAFFLSSGYVFGVVSWIFQRKEVQPF